MNIHTPTAADVAYWASSDNVDEVRQALMLGPDDMPDCEACPALITRTELGTVVRVGLKLDEIELAHLAHGGTIWLSTFGGLPPFMLEVQEPTR